MKFQSIILLMLFSFLSIFNLAAQNQTINRCATMEVDSIRRANNPNIGTLQDFENFLQEEIRKKQEEAKNGFVIGDVYIIPVIVHVVHDNEAVGTGLNISYDRIEDQIQTLQNDFRKIAGSPGDNTHPDGADTKIEFRLARQMPDGTAFPNGEDGVNRVFWDDIPGLTGNGPYSTGQIDADIKPYTNGQGYDPTRYMNFWVCDIAGGILGYAQFPSGGLPGMGCSTPNMATDGQVMTTTSVGGSNFTSGAPPYNIGRTATHEIGHWLGLRHTWGDGGCGVDDFCDDTPESDASNFGCDTGHMSCGSQDMVENYMDYSDDACMNIFTNDQAVRMRTILETSDVRSQLIQSSTWQAPITNSGKVVHIEAPFHEICDQNVTPEVLVSNVGSNTLDDITIEYTIDGGTAISTSFTGLGIAQGTTMTLTLTATTVSLGDHQISIKSISPTLQTDPEIRNFSYTLGFGLPFEENFDDIASFPPPSWQLGSSNNCFIWAVGSGIGADGNGTDAAIAANRDSNVAGEKAFLYTPILTMPCGAQGVTLQFDVAYKQRNGEPNEGLDVEVSTDCGATWQASGYSEFGTTLSNNNSDGGAYIPEDANEWTHKTVDLDAFVDAGTDNQMLLRFVCTNQFGNNLYIDNVKVDATYNEVDVFDNGDEVHDEISVNNFGTTNVGTPISKTFTVTNTGTANLNLNSQPSLTGTAFTVGNFGTTFLAAGASTTFEVTFTATAGGTFTETLSFDTDDCDEANFSFEVRATALACNIASITAGNQTACVHSDGTYTQELTITYSTNPNTGTLDVNGQSFAITASPQTVILTGLISDGNPVNVTANFSAEPACTASQNNLFTAPISCACDISAVTASTQSACDPNTNTYSQDLIINFANPPATGTLDVNGQSFAIAASPQTVTLTGLTADTNPVNVSVEFSDENTCNFTQNALFTAPLNCDCAILTINTTSQAACVPATNTFEQDVIITYKSPPTTGTLDVNGQSFAITTSPQTVTLTALTADANAVDITAVFSDRATCDLTKFAAFTAPPNCECIITSITSGTQSACSPLANIYSQDVIITYANNPTTGTLIINGQNFPITASPQTVTLTNLTADSNPVNVTASFSADNTCNFTQNNVFTAAANCDCNIVSVTTGLQSACDILTNLYTQEIIVNYINAPNTGTLLVAGQSFAITASPQTVLLTDLVSDGNPLDVNTNFSAIPACSNSEIALFTAPASCVPICGIASISASTQTACNNITNFYNQDLIITYLNNPTTGTLIVNGQNFPITGSPQTVSFTNLVSDGNSLDVTAQFSDELTCSKTSLSVFTAPTACDFCDIQDIVANAQTACDPSTQNYTQSLTITYINTPATGNLLVNGQSFAITASPQTVILTGLNSDAAIVNVTASFSDENTCTFTKNNVFTAPSACICGISDLATAIQTTCDTLNNSYTQQVIVTYDNAPFSGNLLVNGQGFPITASPQTVTLTNLTANGNPVNTTANFSAIPTCTFTENALFVSPVDCTPACGVLDFTVGAQTACDPNTGTYTQELHVFYKNPPASGFLEVNGQTFTITGVPFQTVILTGLAATGSPVDVTAFFTASPACRLTKAATFIAPTSCSQHLVVAANETHQGNFLTVTILSGGILNLSGNIDAQNDFVIEEGGTLISDCNVVTGAGNFTLSENATIVICSTDGITQSGNTGDIRVTGTRIFDEDANYQYAGIAPQVTGNGLPRLVKNVTINNSSGVNLSNGTAIKGILNLKEGDLTSNRKLTIYSDQFGTGMVIQKANGSNFVIGEATVQQFMPSYSGSYDARGYRYISSPVNNATLVQIADDMDMTLNTAYNTNARPGRTSPFPSFFYYDETLAGNSNQIATEFVKGWRSPALQSESMLVMQGFSANMARATTIDIDGILNNGSHDFKITDSNHTESGWNLVGNPYPSPISWTKVYNLSTNVDASISRRISTGKYSGTWATFNANAAVGLNGATDNIAMMQGFFVKCNNVGGTGTLKMNNTVRATAYVNPTFFRVENSNEGLIKLAILQDDKIDEAAIYFKDEATDDLDTDFDSRKIQLNSAPYPSLFMEVEGEQIAINGLSSLDKNKIVPLAFYTYKSGKTTIKLDELTNFLDEITVFLEDKKLNVLHNLSKNSSYEFEATEGFDYDRFVILFRPYTNAKDNFQEVFVYPNPTNGKVTLKILGERVGTLDIRIHNSLGQEVQKTRLEKTGFNLETQLNLEKLKSGLYFINIFDGEERVIKSVLKIK